MTWCAHHRDFSKKDMSGLWPGRSRRRCREENDTSRVMSGGDVVSRRWRRVSQRAKARSESVWTSVEARSCDTHRLC